MENGKTATIYALVDPREPGRYRYVGRTVNRRVRHLQHISEVSLSAKCVWIETLKEVGVLPQMIILEVVPIERAEESEGLWIGRCGPDLTNTMSVNGCSIEGVMTHAVLARCLDQWFDRLSKSTNAARRKSPVWVLLKERLGRLGNWKNRARGNPRKGWERSRVK